MVTFHILFEIFIINSLFYAAVSLRNASCEMSNSIYDTGCGFKMRNNISINHVYLVRIISLMSKRKYWKFKKVILYCISIFKIVFIIE